MYTLLTLTVDAAKRNTPIDPQSGQNLFSQISPCLKNRPAAPFDGGHS